jgi:hypothetical protein
MAKKDKQDINPEQFNEFLTYVAQKGPPPGKLSDIFNLVEILVFMIFIKKIIL